MASSSSVEPGFPGDPVLYRFQGREWSLVLVSTACRLVEGSGGHHQEMTLTRSSIGALTEERTVTRPLWKLGVPFVVVAIAWAAYEAFGPSQFAANGLVPYDAVLTGVLGLLLLVITHTEHIWALRSPDGHLWRSWVAEGGAAPEWAEALRAWIVGNWTWFHADR